MKKLLLTILLLFTPIFVLAQNPQTSDVSGTQPLVGVNARWSNGVSPGYWPTAGLSLTLNVSAGTSFCATTIVTYAGGTLTLANNTTNYVYLDTTLSCAPSSNTTGFSSTTIPLAKVVTSGGAIISIQDDRTFFTPTVTGGTGISSLNGLTASSQTFATGTSGTDFNISSIGSIHTFSLPSASASNRGALTNTDWTTFNNKASISGTPVAGNCVSWLSATTIQDSGGTCSGASGGLFQSYQVGVNTPITGGGKFFQLAAGSNVTLGFSGSGTSGSPYVATINSSGGGGAGVLTIANAGTTGTTVNTLTKLTGAPATAVIAATSDTGGIVGITTSGAGITGNATIQISGQVNCVFDGATTSGDYVSISSTTAGNCHDAGASYPVSGEVVGLVLSTNASLGTYTVDLFPADIQGPGSGRTFKIANNGTTGTTLNTVTKLTGAPSTATIAATSDTAGAVGIAVKGSGTSGSATIQLNGLVSCTFDGATTAGDYVKISSTTAGNCHDSGSSFPSSGQILGRVLSTNVASGTYTLNLFPAEIQGGSGTVNSGTAHQLGIYSATGPVISGDSTLTDDGTTLTYTGTGGASAPSFQATGSGGGIIDLTTGTAPANPASGKIRIYGDSGTGNLTCHTSTGASCLPSGGSGPTLQTNGTNNGSQTLLNIKNGPNVTVTDDGVGGVTIASTGGSGTGYAGVNAQSGTTYTTVIGDAGELVTMNNASANTATIPPNSSVAYTVGTIISFAQLGVGQTTIAAGAGVTINTPTSLSCRAQYSTIFVTKIATDTWVAGGDLQ